MKILIADGYNLLYRSRTGFYKGSNPIVFNFFRSFKALVEKFDADKVYFVLEGAPKKRKELAPEYKAQRVYSDHDDFYRQRKIIISMLEEMFPVFVTRHEDHECDDVIGALATDIHSNDECVILSSDTDFIQVLKQDCDRIKLYNPVRKSFVQAPDYNYVEWKALAGDKSDNIEGFERVGSKTAEKLIRSPELLSEFLSHPGRMEKFEKNLELIKFENVDAQAIQYSRCEYDGDKVKSVFTQMEFSSMINEKYWQNFERVFNSGN